VGCKPLVCFGVKLLVQLYGVDVLKVFCHDIGAVTEESARLYGDCKLGKELIAKGLA
jgi:hypothetical protein